jgi:hypothetical protein
MARGNGARLHQAAPAPRAGTSALLRRTVSVYRRQWLRLAVVAAAISVLGTVVVLFLLNGLATIAPAQRSLLVDQEGAFQPRGLVLLALELVVPGAVIMAALLTVWLGAVARLTETSVSGDPVSIRSAMSRGWRRVPAVFGALSLTIVTVAALALLAPLLIAVGIIGLVLTPGIRLVRRRRPGARWPSVRTLVLLLIPFSTAAHVAVRWSLAIPAAAIERNGPRDALRRSRAATAGNVPAIVAVMGVAIVGSLGLQRALVATSERLGATAQQASAARAVLQLFVAAFPIVAATVLFRDSFPTTDAALAITEPAKRRHSPIVHGAAVVLVWTLVATSAAGALLITAAPAQAATRSFTVDSLGEESDDTPGDSICHTVPGTCTLRAALEEANSVATDDYQIGFGVDGVIYTSAPLAVSAPVVIDAVGRRVEINGRACGACAPSSQLLRFTNAAATFGVANLTLRDGLATGASGGGAVETQSLGTLTNVTLAGNTSTTGPGGAVSIVSGSTTLINATFSGNAAPSAADVYNNGSSLIRASTLAGATGSSVENDTAGTLTIDNTIVTASSGANCVGAMTGATNLSDDGSCDGSLGAVTGLGPLADNTGPIDTMNLSVGSNAIDAGTAGVCPPTDARGTARPQGPGCDIGAYELVAGGSTPDTYAVDDLGDASDALPGDGVCATATSVCTLRAAVDEANGGTVQPYTITFSVTGTITVASTITATADVSLVGTGGRVVVDGGSATSLLSFPSSSTPFAIRDLTLAHGTTGDPAGGGAVRASGYGTIENVTFVANVSTAAPGGAVAITAGSSTIRNATFKDDVAPSGADVAVVGGQGKVRYSTLVGASGGSIDNNDAGGAMTDVTASIVAPASGAACAGTTSGNTNLVIDATCSSSLWSVPGLGTFGDHGGFVDTYALSGTSQALEHGDIDTCPSADARGVSRPQNVSCDIGAYELIPTATTVALTVDDLTDAADAAPGDGTCATAAATCSLRAAVQEANAATVAAGAGAILTFDVGFAVDGTITVGSTLDVTSIVHLDGTGRRVTVDGGGAVRIFDLDAGARTVTFANLTLANGSTSASDGGGAIHSAGRGWVTNVTFTGNAALDSSPASAGGGAISVDWDPGASFDIVNATFVGNSTAAPVGGGDVFARGAVTVSYSSFSGATGGAVVADALPASASVQASLFNSASGLNCSASVSGASNISSDASCPGTQSTDPQFAAFGDHGGPVATFSLQSSSPAIDAISGPTCPLADARGVPRPQGAACDLGALEWSNAVAVTVGGTPNPAVASETVNLSATVAGVHDPAMADGTVVFSDGATVLGSVPMTAGGAALAVSTLGVGTHTIQAQYSGDGFFPASSSSFVLDVAAPATALSVVATPAAPLVGEPVTIDAHVLAPSVTQFATGTVDFFDGAVLIGSAPLDASGHTLVSGARASIVTSSLGQGTHSITATYGGDALFPAATSTATSVSVGTASTTTSAGSSSNPSVVGQPVTFTATVSAVAPATGVPAGTVDFLDGAVLLGTASLDAAGVATLTTSSLVVGSHPITAVFAGDASFSGSTSAVVSQSIGPAATTTGVGSSVNPTVVGQSVTFTATVSVAAPGVGIPSGSVAFFDGPVLLGSGSIDAFGVATLGTSALAVGAHPITALFAGDASFSGSTAAVLPQSVGKATTTTAVVSSVNPTVVGQPVTFTATVSVVAPGAGIPTGSVAFFDGAVLLGSGVLDGAGAATFTTSALAAGSHSATAVFGGDGSLTGSTSPVLSQTISPAATTTVVVASVNPSVVGQPVTFTATVAVVAPGAGTPTGTVAFFDGALLLGSGPLDAAGTTAFSTSALVAGPHSVTAVFGGDASFTASTSPALAHAVNAAGAAVVVSSSTNPSVAGESVTLAVTVTSIPPGSIPTGTVDVVDGASTIATVALDATGAATYATSTLAVGPHLLTVVYGGDGTVGAGTSSPLTQTVNQAATSTALVVPSGPSVVGQSATFLATVSAVAPGAGIPTGNVTFFDGATPIGTGSLDALGFATLATAALAVGSHSVTAVFGGDAAFAGSVSPARSHAVNPAATSTLLSSSVNPSGAGQAVTFTAAVSATAPGAGLATGSVDFFDGALLISTGALNGAGVATFVTSTLAPGPHAITATFSGDASFSGSSSAPLGQTVGSAGSSVIVSSSVNPSVVGQPVSLSVTVTAIPAGPTPTGNVAIVEGATTIATAPLDTTGAATVVLPTLGAGSHSLVAVYGGDASVGASSSLPLAHMVNPASTTTAVTTSVDPTVFGQAVTFTATVAAVAPGAGVPSGTVDLLDGGTLVASAPLDASGTATFTTSALGVGTHVVSAAYVADLSFAGSSSSPITQTVNPASTTTALTTSLNPAPAGQVVTFTAIVSVSAPGDGAPTGSVDFFDDGTLAGSSMVDATGAATFSTAALSGGTHTIEAVYAGDAAFFGSGPAALSQDVTAVGSTVTLTSSVNPSVTGESVTFTATIAPATPGISPSGLVAFTDNGAFLGFGDVNGAGLATLTTSTLAVGAHVIVANYAGNASVGASTSAPRNHTVARGATTTAIVASAPSSLIGTSVTFTATVLPVLPASGTPTGTIDFRDGAAVLGTAPVDASGSASIAISTLAAGAHSITAAYAGDVSFVASTSTPAAHSVMSASSSITATALVDPVTYPGSVAIDVLVVAVAPAGGTPTGTVVVNEGASVIGSGPVGAAGTASISLDGLAVGDHLLDVAYSGDAAFAGSTTSITVTVAAAPTSLTVTSAANPDTYPARPRVSATVVSATGSTPTGIIEIYVDGARELGVVLDASATGGFDLIRPPGAYTVTVVYSGDANHLGANAVQLVQTIVVGGSTTTLSASPAASAILGQAVTLTVTVAVSANAPVGPSGTVEFLDGPTVIGVASLSGATATLATTDIGVGTRSLSARYVGDATFGPSLSSSLTYLISPAATTVTVTSSANPSTSGASVDLFADVTAVSPGGGVPAGDVTFTVGAAVLGTATLDAAGRATLTSAAFAVGDNPVVATYGGSPRHLPSNATFTQTVDRAPTATAMTTSVNPSVTGQAVTFTATVSPVSGTGPVTGTVSFFRPTNVLIGTATLGSNGQAAVTVTSLFGSGGAQLIVAQYDGDAEFATSFGTLNQTVNQAGTTITLAATPNPAVVGQSVTITATVAAIAPGGGAPGSGNVVFTDGGTTIATVPVSGGVAQIVRSTPSQLGAFPHLLGASYLASPSASYGSSTAADVVLTVGKGTPALSLTSGSPVAEASQPVTLTALLALSPGAPSPTGTVSVYEGSPAAPGGATLLGSGPVAIIDVPCPPPDEASVCQAPGLIVTTANLAIGDHSLFAAISGDSAYVPAFSAAITQTITTIPTAFVVQSDPAQSEPGQRVAISAYVRNASVVPATAEQSPTGSVTFEDRTALGVVTYPAVTLVPVTSLPGWSLVTLDHQPFGPRGTYHLAATYTPIGGFHSTFTTFDHKVQPLASKLDVVAPPSVVWGQAATITTHVTPLNGSSVAPAPTGAVTVTSDNGLSCASSAVHGGCQLTFPDPGTFHLTVTYAGDGSYLPTTAGLVTIVVNRRPAVITASVSTPQPLTDDPVTLTWSVAGPPAGSVRARIGGTGCPSSLAGSCTAVLPLSAAGQLVPVDVRYDGDDRYVAAQFGMTITPVGCYDVPVAVYPPDAGTMAITLAPNCHGTGYRQGTFIGTVVTPAPPRPDYQYVPFTQYPSGKAGTSQTFVVGTGDGQATYAYAEFRRVAQCVDLELRVDRIASAAGAFVPTEPSNCPGATAPTIAGASTIYHYLRGTSVSLLATTLGAESRLYGVRTQRPLLFGTVPITALPAAPIVMGEDRYFEAVFGPACAVAFVTATGPGTADPVAPTPNCFDPLKAGWLPGTTLTVRAVGNTDTAYLDRWDSAWINGLGTSYLDPASGRRFFENTLTVGTTDVYVDAKFVECVSLETVAVGPGRVERSVAPNCPTKSDVDTSVGPNQNEPSAIGWYKPDTRLVVKAIVTNEMVYRFGKWSGEEDRELIELPITMDHNQLRRASFYEFRECGVLTLKTQPAGWGLVNAKGIIGDDYCPNSSLRPEVPAPNKSGRFFGGNVQFEATATKGNPLVGFELTHPFGVYDVSDRVSTGNMTAHITRTTTATASFCQAVRPTVDLVNPDGKTYRVPSPEDDTTKTDPSSPPWATGITTADQEYITADPEPNCPYRDDAWLVGTTVTFSADAPWEGYSFTKWNGASTGSLFRTEVTFEGDTPFKSLGVTYEVTCHTLTLTGKPAAVHPKPNCPGTNPDSLPTTSTDDAGAAKAMTSTGPPTGSYIGGTTVVLHGDVPKGMVWQGWTGDIDEPGKINPTYVTICAPASSDPDALEPTAPCSAGDPSGDKVASHNWRPKTTGETIKQAFVDLGNGIAIGAKKVFGVVMGALGEFFMGAPPLGILTTVLTIASGIGTLLKYIGVDTQLEKYMDYALETVNFLQSAFTCTSKWGLAASPKPPPPGPVDAPDPTDGVGPQEPDSPPEIAEKDLEDIVQEEVAERMKQIRDDPDGIIRDKLIKQVRDELKKKFTWAKGYTLEDIGKAAGMKGLARLMKSKGASKPKTGAVAWLKSKGKSGFKQGKALYDKYGKKVKVAGAVGYGIYMGVTTPMGWDNDAKSAWTDGSVLYECMHDAVPSYLRPDPIPDYDPTFYE